MQLQFLRTHFGQARLQFLPKIISYCGDKAILVCEFRLKDLVLKSIWRKYLILSDRILLSRKQLKQYMLCLKNITLSYLTSALQRSRKVLRLSQTQRLLRMFSLLQFHIPLPYIYIWRLLLMKDYSSNLNYSMSMLFSYIKMYSSVLL